jgi:hypothetical protein
MSGTIHRSTVVRRVVDKVRSMYWWRRVRLFRALHAARPASLRASMKVQAYAEKRLGDPCALAHLYGVPNEVPLFSAEPELAQHFHGFKWDGFSLRPETLEWLARFLEKRKPRTVLEFGSGYSTLVQCAVLQRLHGPEGFRLLSFEQDARYLQGTEKRLRALPGSASCRVIHVPLVPDTVAGQATLFYEISAHVMEHLEWLGRVEFVFIDGPYAEGPCRYRTLHAVRGHLAQRAYFALDDGLRQKELFVGSLWEREGIHVGGVLTIGCGIMVGSVT